MTEEQIGEEDPLIWSLLGNRMFYRLMFWLGWRSAHWTAIVNFHGDSLRSFAYWITVDDGDAICSCGGIKAGAESERSIELYSRYYLVDENPDIQILRSQKFAPLDLLVEFTDAAPEEMRSHAFSPHLSCLWLFGCRTADDILPQSAVDKVLIEKAAIRRLQSSDPCPENVILRRFADFSDVLLVQVESVQHHWADEELLVPKFKVIRVLKGNRKLRLDSIAVRQRSRRAGESDYPIPHTGCSSRRDFFYYLWTITVPTTRLAASWRPLPRSWKRRRQGTRAFSELL